MKAWETPWFTGTENMSDFVRDGIGRAAAGEIVTNAAVPLNLPSGVRVFDLALRPVRNEAGEVIAIVSEAAEITARVKVEEDLRQAQKLEAVGQLTGGVAHDFNNLLMVISGGLNMLERSPDEQKRDMLMTRMREAVERGANLTKQLLAFSRRHQLSPESIRLPDYFASMNDLLNRSLGVNVRVAVDVPTDVAPVFADPNALQLAILNLAVNARDAMDHSGVVSISARNGSPRDTNAACVSISVADTGAGMTPEVRQRIFEPFFTTKETVERVRQVGRPVNFCWGGPEDSGAPGHLARATAMVGWLLVCGTGNSGCLTSAIVGGMSDPLLDWRLRNKLTRRHLRDRYRHHHGGRIRLL